MDWRFVKPVVLALSMTTSTAGILPTAASRRSCPTRWNGAKIFIPAYDEMRPIIDEITAGLLAFCLEIAATAEARKTV